MLIWGAMIIPVVVTIVLLVWFKHQTVWWEFLVPFVISLVCVIASKSITEAIQTSDTEYWGGWATQAEYYERWDEEVPCKHTKYCTRFVTRTRSDGSSYSDTESYDCGTEHFYDIDNHPPHWVLVDSNGESQSINQDQFEGLAQKWNSRTFVDLNRNYHSIDGDKYVATWDGNDETIVLVTTQHRYENRVQSSNSIFNFEEIKDPGSLGLYEYPRIGTWDQRAILGDGGTRTNQADARLRYWNAKYGAGKQVKMFILIFPEGSALKTGLAQENYWKGGNKNEFTLAIGVDRDRKVTWAHIISWTEVDRLKIDVRDYAMEHEGQLDLMNLVDYMSKEVYEKFERKPFKEFSYLTVEPPGWAVALSYLITLLVNVGLSFWIINNRYEEWTPAPRRW
ncbi:TPA: hypothetical protein DCW61_04405 [Candidatus Uhrbacteria bacterium]|nr:hypothetical protein [Candidatus Uhrbacteria bacterium]